MHKHQQTSTCQKNGLLLNKTQREDHEQELKQNQIEHCKIYYKNNQEKILSQQCDKITCNVCNSLIMKCNLKTHQ